MADFTPWIAPILFVATAIGWAIKYGQDQAKVLARLDRVEDEIKRLEKQFETDVAQNYAQHREFYETKNSTIEIKSDMKHIMRTLDEMKNMLERRGGNRE
jgi:transposase